MIFRQASPAAVIPKGGRVAQKQRTRSDLLRAARELRADGRVPTVSDVADASGISRTTAYRYFPTQEMLLAEAASDPLIAIMKEAIAAVTGETDVVKRVEAVFAALAPVMIRHEAELRTLLKIALDRSLQEMHERHIPQLSGEWVRAWNDILGPLRGKVSLKDYTLMARSLGTLLSVESINVVRDACDLDEQAAAKAICSSARAMVRGFLLDLPKGSPDEIRSVPTMRNRVRRQK